MLATHLGAYSFPPIMVDDNMEISSEYGQHAGDDEIDIDIEFTTVSADEDYAIEDAEPNSGSEGFQPQPSPAVGNDDIMFDEDLNTYAMGDEDVILEDEDHGMEPEAAASISFAMGDSDYPVDEHAEPLQVSEDVDGDITWEEQELPKTSAGETDLLLGDSDQTFHNDVEGHEDGEQNVEENTESSKLPSEHRSGTTTPQNRSPHRADAHSPATSIPPTEPISSERISNHSSPKSERQSVPEVKEEPINFTAANATENFSTSPEVIVIYQAREYTLFSKSESEDPNSYFLSDVSILEKPLSDFFQVIRDVIEEDLGDEDELCVSVEDLGLEVEENCTLNQEASLGQIINLHDTLLRNDGVESHRPLYMALGTRLNFSKRVATLIAEAAEGKGLSQLINWDDASEQIDESGVDESLQSDDAVLNDQDNSEVSAIQPVEPEDPFVVESNHVSPTPPESIHDNQEDEDGAKILDEHQHVYVGLSTVGTAPANNTAGESNASEVLLSTEKNTTNGEYAENEEDIIDYSENEDEEPKSSGRSNSKLHTDDNRAQDGNSADLISPCILPETCFCNACNELLQAEYDAINEELRRRSLTRAAEEIEQSVQHANDENEQHAEVEEAGGEEYDESANAEFDQGGEEGLTTEDILGTDEPENHNEEIPVHGKSKEAKGEKVASGSRNGLVSGRNVSVDVKELQFLGSELREEVALAHLQDRQFNDELEVDSNPNGNGDLNDAAESNVTVSADDQHYGEEDLGEYDLDDSKDTCDSHTLDNGTSNGATDDQEDEINYEDDEENEESSNGVPVPLPAAGDAPTSNGKRPRADAEADDTSRSKEAKRPRS